MPTIAVDKADLWKRLGQEFCIQQPLCRLHRVSNLAPIATDDFDKLCFDYGLELDEDVCSF